MLSWRQLGELEMGVGREREKFEDDEELEDNENLENDRELGAAEAVFRG